MKKTLVLIILALLLLLSACSGANNGGNETAPEADSSYDIAFEGVAETDPSEPPIMQISYDNGEIAGATTLGTYTYSWTWEENGQWISKEADAIHPLDDPDIRSIRLSDTDGTVKILADARLVEARVSVWALGAGYDDVNILFPEDGVIELSPEPSIYEIQADYGDDNVVNYAFLAE